MQGCHDLDMVMAHLSVVSLMEAYTPHASGMEVSYDQEEAIKEEEEQGVDGPCLEPFDPEESVKEEEEKGFDGPCWADMLPDALVKVFSHLSVEEMLCTIPCVCQTWRRVSQDASCWQSVDLSEWIQDRQPQIIERMLLLVMNRSQGSLREICAPNLSSDEMLRVIACSGSHLQVLRIPDSFVSEECICELAPKFTSLTYLDISGRCPSKAWVESFGKHSQFIRRLNLNMRLNTSTSKSCDVAALAVAQYMPQLRHLEMAYGLLSNIGLKALLENCRSLEYLDLRGCWHVSMEKSLTQEASKRIKVFFPPGVEIDMSDDDDDIDSYDEYDLDYHASDYYDEYEFENYDWM